MKLLLVGLFTFCGFSGALYGQYDGTKPVVSPQQLTSTSPTTWPLPVPTRTMKDDDVVQVSSFEKNQQVTDLTAFTNFTDIEAFASSALYQSPNRVIRVISQFLADNPELPASQKVDLIRLLSLAHYAEGDHQLAQIKLTKTLQMMPEMAVGQRQKIEAQLAQFYQQDNDYYQAQKKLIVAFNLARTSQSIRDCVILAQKLAGNYLELNDLDAANRWLQIAQNMALNQGNEITRLVYYLQKSRLHLLVDERFLAEQAAKQAMSLAQSLNLTHSHNEASLLLSTILLKGRKFLHAEPILQQLFDKAQKHRDKGTQFEVLLEIVEHQIAQQQFDLAGHYHQLAKSFFQYAASKPNAIALRDKYTWQQVRLSMANNKWLQAKGQIEQLPLEAHPHYLVNYIVILAQTDRMSLLEQTLTRYTSLMLAQQSREHARLQLYKTHVAGEKLATATHRLKELQSKTANYIEQTTQLLATKSTMISILLLVMFGLVFIVLARRFSIADDTPRDPLTGLPNFSFLHRDIPKRITSNQPFSFLLVDLDDFKRFNEAVGFEQGDKILLDVVHQIQELLPGSSLLGRLGSDSFYIVSSGFNTNQAKILADRIRLQLHKCGAAIQSDLGKLTGSVAVVNRLDFSDIHQMLSAATKMLEQTQNSAQDKTVVFISNC